METMHAAGRRTLPPVPRGGGERQRLQPDTPSADIAEPSVDVPTQRFVVDFTTGEQRRVHPREDRVPPLRDAPATADDGADLAEQTPESRASLDAAESFVARLRSAAADFAEAAGAESAVVREAVPPARHRRARCRVVLGYADDAEVDVTFLGPSGTPGTPSRHGFERQIRRWFAAGQHREQAWLVPDEDALDGLAVDVSAWLAAG